MKRAITYKLYKKTKTKVINTTLSLTLLASSLSGALPLFLSQHAFADAATSVVTPSNLQNWYLYNDQTDTMVSGNSDHDFVTGPATPPAGSGSVHLTKTTTDKYGVATNQFAGTKLSDISNLSYATYRASGTSAQAPSLGFDVDSNTADGDTGYQGRLTYEPYFTHTVNTGTWQTWNTQDNAGTGNWWFSHATLSGGAASACTQSNPCTWSELVSAYPNADIAGRFILRTNGADNEAFSGNVDNLTFNSSTYDFDTTPYIPTTPPTRPSVPGEVIYDSIPSVLPSNSPSLGYEATSTSAFGDKVTFAGSGRHLGNVAVMLSSWACESGEWTSGCTTTPGATFTQPLTLNIYNVASDGSVGSLIATRTQTFTIPYRPTADPTCPTATQWRDTNGDCFNGLNHVATFDASGITVPNTVIYSIGYNTQNYGSAPTGSDGPYDSLNVSLTTGAANVGTNVNTDEVFWDTTYPGYTAGLKADSGWSSDGNPAVLFTADQPPSVNFVSPTPAENSTVSGTITAHVQATDDVGMGSYYVRVWKGAFESGPSNLVYNSCSSAPGGSLLGTSKDVSCSIDTSGWDDGTYVISAQFQDSSIQWGQALRTIHVDNTAPAAPSSLSWKTDTNVTVANNGATNRYSGAASWQDTTPSDVDHYVYKYWNDITGNPYKVGTEYTTNVGGTSLAGVFNQGEGVHHFCVEAVDASGNTSACTEFTITYDTTKPTTLLNAPASGAVNPASISLTATDNLGLNKVTANIYDSTNTTLIKSCSATANSNPYTLSCPISSLSDGTYTIRYNASDKAGNVSTTKTSQFVIDNTAPDVPTASLNQNSDNAAVADGGSTNSEYFTFHLPAGVDHFQLKYWNNISGSPFNGQSHAWNPTNLSGYMPTSTTYVDHFTQGEGTHYFAFSACDTVGNCSAYSTPFTVKYDTTEPVVIVNTLSTTDTTPTLTGTADDSSATVKVTVNGHVYTATVTGNTWSVEVTDALPVGSYDIVVTATDAAGNAGTDSTTNELTITAPAVLGASTSNSNVTSTSSQNSSTENTNNSDNGSAPEVLGDSTTTPNTTEDNTGNVKGDSTSTESESKDTKKAASNDNFLGLGWWWLLVLLALGFPLWILGKRRAAKDA